MRTSYLIKQAAGGLSKRRGLSLILVVCVACCFLVFDAFILVSLNLSRLEQKLREKVQIEVYLTDDITPLELHMLLGGIQGSREVERVEYVSKRGAWAHLESFLGKGTLEGVSSSTLPASLLLTLRSEYRRFEQVAPLASEFEEREGVEEVEFGEAWLKKLDRTVSALSLATLILGVLIAAAVVVIVSNFMRLIVGSQAETIRIMSLLGASRGKATLPLLIQGLLLGGAGTSAAILCLWMACSVLTNQMLSITFLPPHMILSLIVWGMILGACGTFVSSTRYLKLQMS